MQQMLNKMKSNDKTFIVNRKLLFICILTHNIDKIPPVNKD